MIGAIAGDIIGSVFERHPIKTTSFPLFSKSSRFTDDTVLSLALADAILNQTDYATTLKTYGRKYPNAGYGMSFYSWMQSAEIKPYNSWGNGSAMRVSPVGFAFDSTEDVLREAEITASVTHNHPEGIKGAQAHYGKIPLKIIDQVKQRLPQEFLLVIDQFNSTFGSGF